MKAKVKETGEIVDVIPYNRDGFAYIQDDEETVYEFHELEILDDSDYWTRLEHKTAIAAMQALLSSDTMMGILSRRDNGTMEEEVAREAFDYAHALVEKLKEKEEK